MEEDRTNIYYLRPPLLGAVRKLMLLFDILEPLQELKPILRNRFLRLSQLAPLISDGYPDRQKKDQSASIHNLHKNEGNIDSCDIFISESDIAVFKDVDAIGFDDDQYRAILSKCQWLPPEQPIVGHDTNIYATLTVAQHPFSRDSIPGDPAGKPNHSNNLRNVFVRRLEENSIAATTLHFGNTTITKQSKNVFKDKRGICSRYRFKQNHLRFLGTFADVRDQPGWIFPTAAKILVNVAQTEITDAWKGQVEGSEERGMFLCSAVEPV
jgi:hypothetical protein